MLFFSNYFCDFVASSPVFQHPLKNREYHTDTAPSSTSKSRKKCFFKKKKFTLPVYRITRKLLALRVGKTSLFVKVCTFDTRDYLSAESRGLNTLLLPIPISVC